MVTTMVLIGTHTSYYDPDTPFSRVTSQKHRKCSPVLPYTETLFQSVQNSFT